MSRTYRRKSGDRSWMKMEPEYEYVPIQVRYQRMVNYQDYCRYSLSRFSILCRKPVVPVYVWRTYTAHIKVPITLKRVDWKYVKEMERDWGNFTPSRQYKSLVNAKDRQCRRNELHKIMKQLDYEDCYYDDSYENSAQRSLIWCVY